MTLQLTTAQALKSFAGTAIFGLSMDAASLVSCHLREAVWFALREGVGMLLWSVLNGLEAMHTPMPGQDLGLLACPLGVLHSLASLAHLLGTAV